MPGFTKLICDGAVAALVVVGALVHSALFRATVFVAVAVSVGFDYWREGLDGVSADAVFWRHDLALRSDFATGLTLGSIIALAAIVIGRRYTVT